MFLNYIALGSKQLDLADWFRVHQSRVSWIITMWNNFIHCPRFCQDLNTIREEKIREYLPRFWIPEEKIREHLPAKFNDYADATK